MDSSLAAELRGGMDVHVGQTFGDYTITGLVGGGAMGPIYRVEHGLTKRTEAMKILSAELATDTQFKRFEREMRVLARLSHPNIAALHNAVRNEQQLLLLMEFVEGRTVESIFAAGRLPSTTGITYIKQLLSAVDYSHQQGVVHRDITPGNIIVTAAGDVKLTDFGLSKSFGDPLLTNCGDILETLPYLAPEQLKGVTKPDKRSDLYAVGAILYEHLTGQKAFGTTRRLAPVLTDTEAEPQPPSQVDPTLSPGWDSIIRRALDRNPEHRYQSAQEFLVAIGQVDSTVPEVQLPQLNKLTWGLAILAGLVPAVINSPAIASATRLFRLDTSPVAPLRLLYIAPPYFATLTPPPPPSIGIPAPKHVLHATTANVIERPPAFTSGDDTPATLGPTPVKADIGSPSVADSDRLQNQPKPRRGFWKHHESV